MNEKLKAALEGLAPLDPELQWAATELAETYARSEREAGRKFSTGAFTVAFCPAVAELVAGRLDANPSSERLTPAEASLIGSNALVRLDPDQTLGFQARVELAARFVVAAAKLRAVSPVSHEGLRTDYWPFGMDGGFCNPTRLQQNA